LLHTSNPANENSSSTRKNLLNQRIPHSLDGLTVRARSSDSESNSTLTEPPKALTEPPKTLTEPFKDNAEIASDGVVTNKEHQSHINLHEIEATLTSKVQFCRENDLPVCFIFFYYQK
jgi:hypothetical protein